MKGYDETLDSLGLSRPFLDLAIKDGDIALNDYGDFLLTDPETDALYRFINKWRFQEKTIIDLFNLWKETHLERGMLEQKAKYWTSKQHMENEELAESYREAEASVAGSIFVLLNTLFNILKRASQPQSVINVKGISLQKIIQATSNNFRHYDEWSHSSPYTNQQKKSADILCDLLGIDKNAKNKPIVNNVCSEVLSVLSNGDFKNIHELVSLIAKEYQTNVLSQSS